MKLLLDENLPHQLRHELPGHDCFTVAYMGWGGIENGTLLSLAASHGFDAVLTKDTKVEYEQNLTNPPYRGYRDRCRIKRHRGYSADYSHPPRAPAAADGEKCDARSILPFPRTASDEIVIAKKTAGCTPKKLLRSKRSRGGIGHAMPAGIPAARVRPDATAGGCDIGYAWDYVPRFFPSQKPTMRREKGLCPKVHSVARRSRRFGGGVGLAV